MSTHKKRYVIIGNGVAGTTAAETLRKNDLTCHIQLITNEAYPLYNRVSLPRFLQGTLSEQKVMLRDRAWHEQHNLELLTEVLIKQVNTDERVVITEANHYIPYDVLLIASGGWANSLQVPGAQQTKNIYNFVTLDDTKALINAMYEARTALAYGGSFIAYELCDGFAHRQLNTTWLMRGSYWLRNALDAEGGEIVDALASKCGVEVIHEDEITSVVSKDGIPKYVRTKQGREIQADMIGIGLGITSNTSFLSETPLKINQGVVVNEYLETTVSHVYAAGDIAEFYDQTLGTHHTVGTWDNALAHGRVAATNMAGGHVPYIDVPTYTSPLFDANIAVIGSANSHNSALETLTLRGPGEKGNENYRKLFFQGKKLVGVLMIGSPKGRKKLLESVKNQQIFATLSEQKALLTIK